MAEEGDRVETCQHDLLDARPEIMCVGTRCPVEVFADDGHTADTLLALRRGLGDLLFKKQTMEPA